MANSLSLLFGDVKGKNMLKYNIIRIWKYFMMNIMNFVKRKLFVEIVFGFSDYINLILE